MSKHNAFVFFFIYSFLILDNKALDLNLITLIPLEPNLVVGMKWVGAAIAHSTANVNRKYSENRQNHRMVLTEIQEVYNQTCAESITNSVRLLAQYNFKRNTFRCNAILTC